MKKDSPFLSAFFASLYIVAIAFLINTMSSRVSESDETLLVPIAMLALFVLSAAIMGFLFLNTPLRLYFEDRKQQAVSHFVRTVGIFAVFVVLLWLSLFYNLL